MSNSVGVVVTTRVVAGFIQDHRLQGELREFPENLDTTNGLIEVPADHLCDLVCEAIAATVSGSSAEAAGIAMPGYLHQGVILDSPNLPQLKGARVCDSIRAGLRKRGLQLNISVFNDADAVAAGIAATRGQLDRQIRVWTIGNGIGYGRYPWTEGPWEGGHMVVSLDPREKYCGCGGLGHLEGIMGHRAMRLRFLDLEPEEIFANAKSGDARCEAFVKLWHRALAAATATSIHMDGPGEFYVGGQNARFVDLARLDRYLHDFVKMSPLQGSRFEVVATSDEVGVIGAAVNAERFVAGGSS